MNKKQMWKTPKNMKLQEELPNNFHPKSPLNEILRGAKRHMQDIFPPLTGVQNGKVIEIITRAVYETSTLEGLN